MKKPFQIIVTILGIMLLAYAIYLAYSPNSQNGITDVNNEYAQQPDAGLPRNMAVVGSFICLPHKNAGEMVTLECAYGIKSDTGEIYALDLAILAVDERTKIESGQHVQVTGSMVPVEALSSDHWQKYDMKGILQAKTVVAL